MMTIEQKLKELKDFNINYYKEQIADLEMLLSNNKKKSGGFTLIKHLHTSKNEIEKILIKIKQDYENLKNDKFDDIFGWDYFDDVCYLNDVMKNKFNNMMIRVFTEFNLNEYPKEKIFKHINKIAYYDNEIDRLKNTQSKYNANKIRKQVPSKEVLTILKFIGDNNELTEPLLRFLKSMNGNYENTLSYKQRELYLNCSSKSIEHPKLNIDRIQELKKSRKEEEKFLLYTIKTHKAKYAKNVFNEIMNYQN